MAGSEVIYVHREVIMVLLNRSKERSVQNDQREGEDGWDQPTGGRTGK